MRTFFGWAGLASILILTAITLTACGQSTTSSAPAAPVTAAKAVPASATTATAAAATNTYPPISAPEKLSEEGFVPIFNGKDLSEWNGDSIHWSVKDGAIHGEATKETMVNGGNTFLIWKGGKPEDFELRLSCKMVGGNSGIQYRSFTPVTNPEKYFVGGYQMEVSTDPKKSGFIYGELFRGVSMCDVGQKCVWNGGKKVVGSLGDPAEIAKNFKKDDWNDYRIVAKGNHIDHYLNGIHVVDFTDEDPKAPTSGVIAVQIHQGYVMTVEFKDIRLKTFPKDAAPKAETK
jgi:hypothetical protein